MDLPPQSLDLSNNIRVLRAAVGLKNTAIARRMTIDASIVSLWENGKRLVPANRFQRLADALETDVETLIGPPLELDQFQRVVPMHVDTAPLPPPSPEPDPPLLTLLLPQETPPEAPAPEPLEAAPKSDLEWMRLLKPQYLWCDSLHGVDEPLPGSRRGGRVHQHGWAPRVHLQ